MRSAIQSEVDGLSKRENFKVILKGDVFSDANAIPGRSIHSIKSEKDNCESCKARFFIWGHRDRLKKMMVHSFQTLQPSSIKMILAFTAAHSFNIWTSYVRQTHPQYRDPLRRDVI